MAVCGIAAGTVMLLPRDAGADPCHSHQPACCPVVIDPCVGAWPASCSYQSFYGTGWNLGGCGFGVTRYRSFTHATPGFWCGWSYPCVTPIYGWGCNPFLPRVWAPPVVCYPGGFVPAFGPVGVYPFLGFGARGGTTIMQIGRGPTVHVRQVAAVANDPVRPSNAAARDRAAKLVATGDQHLRAALADRTKLQRALDAYRRAEKIAADQPDTFLRQAIVLTALDRADDAKTAVHRAIAIDGRLAEQEPAAVAGADRLPPDPVFGDRPLGGPSLLAERSAGLIGGIFGAEAEDTDGPNWIADRWSRRWQDGRGLIAAK
ncbi:MAG: hypothetical protein WCR51_13895 [Planctomycetia bacterium]